MTVMDRRAAAPAASVTPAPTADHLMHTPLPDLLAETGVELFDTSIADAAFFGAVVQRETGGLVLAMPTGRSEIEHDTIARYLIAQTFDVELPALAAPFVTTTL